jgi:tetratricopeptide (TPR) repeat protein
VIRSLALVFLLFPSVAAADDLEAASAAFREGERAFLEDDYELALSHFRRAFELAPHDAVRFNVAVCLERLARFREAAAEYELAAASETLPPEERARASELRERVRSRLGTLEVRGTEGADVLIDGEPLCTVPCTIELDPSSYPITIVRGDARAEATAAVRRGEREIVELEARVPDETPEPAAAIDHETRGLGWLSAIGFSLAGIGAGCLVGCGLYAQSLHDDYVAMPSTSTRDEGLVFRDLANVAIAVAGAGAILVLVDILFFARELEEVEPQVPATNARLAATGAL